MRWSSDGPWLLWLIAISACNAMFGIDDYRQREDAEGVAQQGGDGGVANGSATVSSTGGSTASSGGALPAGGAGGSAVKTLIFRANAALPGPDSLYTFGAVPIGPPSADRRIIVGAVGNQETHAVVQLSVAGIDAELIDQVIGNQEHATVLAVAHVTDGATADIVVSFGGAQGRAGIGVWSATGLAANAPHDFASTAAQPTSVTVDTLPGGFVVAMAGHVDSLAAVWVNAEERFDSLVAGHDSRYSGADASTAGGSLVVQVDLDNGRRGLVAAAW